MQLEIQTPSMISLSLHDTLAPRGWYARFAPCVPRELMEWVVNGPSDRELEELATAVHPPAALEAGNVIEAFSTNPTIAALFDRSARVSECMSVREHSSRVLRQLTNYAFEHDEAANGLRTLLITTAALHDIGKSLPLDVHEQHLFTARIIRNIRPALPLDEVNFTRLLTLCGNDLVGELFRGSTKSPFWTGARSELWTAFREHRLEYPTLREAMRNAAPTLRPEVDIAQALEKTATALTGLARLTEFSPREYLQLQMAFYQMDSSSYSVDCGGLPVLERLYELPDEWKIWSGAPLFHWEDGAHRLKFCPTIERLANDLESQI